MLAKKAVYENGKITFPDKQIPKGKMDVIVTFLQNTPVLDNLEGKRQAFIKKWAGFLKESQIDHWKEDKINYLQEKYQ